MDAGIEEVHEEAPFLKDGGLVLVLVELVVDILKLNGFGVVIIRHAANAVGEYPLKRDAVLCGFLSFILSLSIGDCGFNLPLLRSCELSCLRQYGVPPYPDCPDA